MNKYEELLTSAEDNGLTVKEADLQTHDGLIYGQCIAIRKSLPTSISKACVLAEEIGHSVKNAGDVLDQNDVINRQQERKARLWAYDNMIGLIGLVNAFKAGCRNRYEAADYLEVTEEFLIDALEAYRERYGCDVKIDHYLIRFEPMLTVVRMF